MSSYLSFNIASIEVCQKHKKYDFRPEFNLELFQLQITNGLFIMKFRELKIVLGIDLPKWQFIPNTSKVKDVFGIEPIF